MLTSKASSSVLFVATQPAQAIPEKVAVRTEQVRRALFDGADYGFGQLVADTMKWRKERHSREVNGHDRLSVELVFADVLVHEARGSQDKAAQILAAFQRPLCPVIRHRDGQYFLEFDEAES